MKVKKNKQVTPDTAFASRNQSNRSSRRWAWEQPWRLQRVFEYTAYVAWAGGRWQSSSHKWRRRRSTWRGSYKRASRKWSSRTNRCGGMNRRQQSWARRRTIRLKTRYLLQLARLSRRWNCDSVTKKKQRLVKVAMQCNAKQYNIMYYYMTQCNTI